MSGFTTPFPRYALVGAGFAVAIALLAAMAPRLGISPPPATPADKRVAAGVTAVASRDLRFADRADGALLVIDARTGATADIIQPGEPSGFIRGILRALARERMQHGVSAGPAFRLTAWRDGSLSLKDLATDRTIELAAFGKDNVASFARYLKAGA